jgi:hypothetical protein
MPNKTLVTTSRNERKLTYCCNEEVPCPQWLKQRIQTQFGNSSQNNLATYFAQLLESKDCFLKSPHTNQGLPFYTKEEGENTWYMELWDNGKQVGGHEAGENTGPKQELQSHPNVNMAQHHKI